MEVKTKVAMISSIGEDARFSEFWSGHAIEWEKSIHQKGRGAVLRLRYTMN
jgi:hypothetical protein